MDTEILLPPDPTSARRARQHVVAALGRAGLPDLADTAALLVSEVVTNALLHAHTEVRLGVRVLPSGVRVEVADRSPRQPTRRRPSTESATGRGLLLLEELASRWGVDPASGGKAVWFELRGAARAGAPVSRAPRRTA